VRQKKEATLGISLIPVLFLMAFLFYATMVNNVWLTGWIDVHIPLLFAGFVAGIIAIFVLNYTWSELEEGIVDLIKSAMAAVIIMMIIGVIIGTWLAGGIVPAMIYYGLKLLNPSIFLVVTLLLCSIISVATGSSWTSVATVGIALMGIGQGLGIPVPVIGGCIISGSYFGDKMSPLSDTTNLAPGITEVKLFDHIRHMIYTTGPSYVITLVVFSILGMKYAGGEMNSEGINAMLAALEGTFSLSPVLLLIPVIVIVMVVMKIPATPALFIGSLLGGMCAFVFQGVGFLGIIDAMHYGYGVDTGNEIVNSLVSGGGLDSMMWTISLMLCAMVFGGIMEKTNMLGAIAAGILKFANSTGDLILATLLTCIAMNFVAGDQYLSIVIPGRMYKNEYDRRGLDRRNLSRTLEDAATLTSPLVPWNSCGAFMMGTLGLTPWTYVPYCVLNLVNPVIAAIYGYTGFSIKKAEEVTEISA